VSGDNLCYKIAHDIVTDNCFPSDLGDLNWLAADPYEELACSVASCLEKYLRRYQKEIAELEPL
jgi:hypothetical protein